MRRKQWVTAHAIVCLAAVATVPLAAQSVITTVAGTGLLFPAGRAATATPLGGPDNVSVDAAGNVYVCSVSFNVIVRIGADGIATVFAGNSINGLSGEGGPAVNASLSQPTDVVFDAAGRAYIADGNNSRIRRVELDGSIRTIAGDGSYTAGGDGEPALQAGLDYPNGLAFDAAGNLYVSQFYESLVRKITPGGIITTVAGNGNRGYSGDGGPATAASLNRPYGLAVDAAGNLYIADTFNSRVRRVTPDGIITTFAGNGSDSPSGDGGPATAAGLSGPSDVAFDATGALFIADGGGDQVRKVTPDGIITTVAGTGQRGFAGDGGPARNAQLAEPLRIALDAAGNLYIQEDVNQRIRRVTPDGIIDTFAGNGNGRFAGDGDAAIRAAFDFPYRVAVDPAGSLYVSDTFNHRVRKITSSGLVSTIAGDGAIGFRGDGGPATAASFDEPEGIAIDAFSNLYVADRLNHRIRKITPGGVITTVAGNGADDFSGDGGPATEASLKAPQAVVLDRAQNLYIADRDNNRIRKVSRDGTITTFAGTGEADFSGDGGPATAAALNRPADLTFDAAGNLYIADTDNERVRVVTTGGIIHTVAGNGRYRYGGDGGPATEASFRNPSAIAVDPAGNIYVADADNHRIRRIDPNGIITTFAGTGDYGFSGDGGPPAGAQLYDPEGLAFDKNGVLYIADVQNDRIRAVLPAPPTFGPLPSSITLRTKAAAATPAARLLTLTSSLPGLLYQAQTASDDPPGWLQVTPSSGSMPSAVEIRADAATLAPGTYRGSVTFQAPAGSPPVQTVQVTFTVDPGDTPAFQAQPDALSFTLVTGAPAQSKSVRVINTGPGSIPFSATIDPPAPWLAVNPASGSISAASPASLTVTADPAMLAPGTYTSAILLISAAAPTRRIPVVLTVSAAPQTIVVSQAGLSFATTAGGGPAPAQAIQILNSGQGVMNWTVTAQPATGNWLRVAPSTGSSDAYRGSAPQTLVATDATGLAPGRYYGRIAVTAAQSANSPQYVSVVLNVADPAAPPPPAVSSSRLVFTAAAGGLDPSSQRLLVSNVGSAPLTFTSAKITRGGNWLVADPSNATVTPGTPAQIVVQPQILGLDPGAYTGTINFQFSDGSLASVDVLLILTATPPDQLGRRATGCQPTTLYPAFTALPRQFSVPAAWPVSLVVEVVDNCGAAMNEGSVVASFSNGDPPLSLDPLGDGRWSATWTPGVSGGNTFITVDAQDALSGAKGSSGRTGGVNAPRDAPVIAAHGIASAANGDTASPFAPGTMIAITGTNLADGAAVAGALPLPDSLNGTQVLVGAASAVLSSITPTEIDAILPTGLTPNTTQQILILRGDSLSTPQPIPVAPAQPAIFVMGTQPAVVDPQYRLIGPGNPAHPGDTIVLYAAGLGLTDPPIDAGAAAPTDGLAFASNPVTATIAGQPAPVAFAGLAPGLVGLYQINVAIPATVEPSPETPLAITAAGLSSQVTIVVR